MKSTPPDKGAEALAAWLESPGSAPAPAELDEDVVQMVGVFDAERAPAPQLDLDALLDSLTEGPLAGGGGGGEVIPFEPRRRWGRWMTGASSVLAVAAAGLLMLRTTGMEELSNGAVARQEAPPRKAELAPAPEAPAVTEALAEADAAPARADDAFADEEGVAEVADASAAPSAPAMAPPRPVASPAPPPRPTTRSASRPPVAQAPTGMAAPDVRPAAPAEELAAAEPVADAIAPAPAVYATSEAKSAPSAPADPVRTLRQLAKQRQYHEFHRLAERTLASGNLTQRQLIQVLELQGDVYEAEGRVAEAKAARAQAAALQ